MTAHHGLPGSSLTTTWGIINEQLMPVQLMSGCRCPHSVAAAVPAALQPCDSNGRTAELVPVSVDCASLLSDYGGQCS
jgi:hypothetical protein